MLHFNFLKKLVWLLFIPIFSHAQINDYRNALEIILKSVEFSQYKKSNLYYVSEEKIIFSKMAKYFRNEFLQDSIVLNDIEIIKDGNKENYLDTSLRNLNISSSSNITIYFSEIKDGYFMSELKEEKNSLGIYDRRDYFGISHIFLFKKRKDEEIELLKIKKISYN